MSDSGDSDPRSWPDQPAPLPGGGELLLRRIPADEGWIGSRGEDAEGESTADEEPRHRVRFAKDFYLGKFVVTQEEWPVVAELSTALRETEATPVPRDYRAQTIRILKEHVEAGALPRDDVASWMAGNPTDKAWKRMYIAMAGELGEYSEEGGPGVDPSEGKGDRRPVNRVSWKDATSWLKEWSKWAVQNHPQSWLAERLGEGWELRLPWEVEWEYACRAGTETEYYSGDGEGALTEVGWYEANSGGFAHEVGEREEGHPFGLMGMHGNIWEWCQDVYHNVAYRCRVDGDGPLVEELREGETPDGQPRVMRGGSWVDTPRGCQSAFRYRNHPGYRNRIVGFRVCLAPGPAKPQTEKAEAKPGAEDGGGKPEPTAPEDAGADDVRADLSRAEFPPRDDGIDNQ